MKSISKVLLMLCLGISSAHAAVITQTQSFPANTPGSTYNLTFNQFNSAGTLTSIEIIYNLYIYGGAVSVDNDSESPQTVTANIALSGGLASTDVKLRSSDENVWATVNNQISQTYNLAATSGDNIGIFNATGKDDYASFVGPNSGNANLVTKDAFVDTDRFDAETTYKGYMGAGTYTISTLTTQTSNASGNAQYAVTMMQTYGNVTVIYNYTPVPEPATASLAGFGLLLLLRRRRQV